MWGFYNARNRKLANHILDLIIHKNTSRIYNNNGGSPKYFDQYFLAQYVSPLIYSNSIMHDSYLCHIWGGKPFPTKRKGDCFIGSPNACSESHYNPFFDCSILCRPPNHPDWIQC